jgi:hypothetical protein
MTGLWRRGVRGNGGKTPLMAAMVRAVQPALLAEARYDNLMRGCGKADAATCRKATRSRISLWAARRAWAGFLASA